MSGNNYKAVWVAGAAAIATTAAVLVATKKQQAAAAAELAKTKAALATATGATKVYLVTGANTGLGLDASRQLALKPETKKVYLACRTESKAVAAIQDLVDQCGIPADRLAYVHFNASDSSTDIAKITIPEPLDGIILNAGGPGHDAVGKPMGPNIVVDQIQSNILGHIHLINTLHSNGNIKNTTIIYSGSEAARGMPLIGMAAPQMPDTVDEYKALMTTGVAGATAFDPMVYYSYTKGLAALYWAAWARRNPHTFVLVVSPGASSGTSVMSHAAAPVVMRLFMPVIHKVFSAMGELHGVEVGAQRYVDAIMRSEEPYSSFKSGDFIASAQGTSGPVCEQTANIPEAAQYANKDKQEAAFEALSSYK